MNILLITTLLLDLSRIFLGFFLKPIHPTMNAKKFQIHGVKYTRKYICESIESVYSCPQVKLSPRFLSSLLQAEGNYPFLLNKVFWKSMFPQQEGEDYGAEIITKIKLARVLVTSFDKFYFTIYNLYSFGFCFFFFFVS